MSAKTKKTIQKRQENFVLEYIKDFNATQAAIRAGYSKKTAKEQGYRLFTNAHILGKINSELDNLFENKREILKNRLLGELEKIALFDAGKFDQGDYKNSPYSAAIKKVKIINRIGEKSSTEEITFEFHDKIAAIKELFKYLNFTKPSEFPENWEINFENLVKYISGQPVGGTAKYIELLRAVIDNERVKTIAANTFPKEKVIAIMESFFNAARVIFADKPDEFKKFVEIAKQNIDGFKKDGVVIE
ncbi:MAG: terminase small subunit [Bacteroidota bacterium]